MAIELSNEMFINMKASDIPPWNPKLHFYEQKIDSIDFWENELRKCREGINIGGYYVHPWLYFHLNFYKTPIPTINNMGKSVDVIKNASLNDLLFFIIETYKEAEEKNKIMAMFGTRGSTKSSVASSNAHWTTLAYGNGTFKVVGGSTGDLKDIGNLMKVSFNNIEKPLFLPTLSATWDDHIEFGYKDKNINSGKREVHSEIMFSNVEGGTKKKSEKTAGGSPIGYIADEIGKYDFLGPLEAATPAFKANGQYRFVPILAGTSGNAVLTKDAKKVLSNPEAYEILPMNWDLLNRIVPEEFITWKEDIGRKFGTFMPGQMTLRLLTSKKPQPFDKFLGQKNSDLAKINIFVSDWENISKEIENLTDDSLVGKETEKSKMYYPTKIDHIWLTDSPNPFPKEAIIRRIRELRETGRTGRTGKIIMDNGKISFEFSDRKRAEVSHPGGPIDSPTIIYGELPETPPPLYTFAGGLDDYKTDVSTTDSLGAFYVLKRRNTDLNQPCELIALSYVSRPQEHKRLHEEIENNIEAFSAMTLMEYIDTTFETYLANKNKDYKWLAPAMSFSKSSKDNPRALARKFGLPPTAGNNEYRFNFLVDWTWEKHELDIDENGVVIFKYGVEFIDDIDLLEEMLAYKKGGNFDRIVAFSHALLLCNHWDTNNIRPKSKKEGTKSQYSTLNSSKKTARKTHSPYTLDPRLRNPYGRRR